MYLPKDHNDTVQILCNDPEEREHIKHLLLADYHTLCVENGGKRWFSKDVPEDERIAYRNARKAFLK
jgi:hypothetical protein